MLLSCDLIGRLRATLLYARVPLLHTFLGQSVCYVTIYLFVGNYAISSATV